MDTERAAEKAAAQDLRGIAANTARDLALSLRLASRRMESFEPGQGKDAARELAEQLSASARRAVELYYLESLTQAVAISEGPVKLRRANEAEALDQDELFDIQRLKSEVTGCYNKVGFMLLLECELERSRRRRLPVSIALFKLDEPDETIVREVAREGRDCCRLLDVLGTFGHRGVGMLLPDTGAEGAQVAVQRLVGSYLSARQSSLEEAGQGELRVGVATSPDDGTDPGVLLRTADERAGGVSLVGD